MTRPWIVVEWSGKDVLAHLYEWEGMILNWLKTIQSGGTPSVPEDHPLGQRVNGWRD